MSENNIIVVGIFVVDLAFVASKLPLPGGARHREGPS